MLMNLPKIIGLSAQDSSPCLFNYALHHPSLRSGNPQNPLVIWWDSQEANMGNFLAKAALKVSYFRLLIFEDSAYHKNNEHTFHKRINKCL